MSAPAPKENTWKDKLKISKEEAWHLVKATCVVAFGTAFGIKEMPQIYPAWFRPLPVLILGAMAFSLPPYFGVISFSILVNQMQVTLGLYVTFALLGCYTVSKGLMMGMYSIWAIWSTSLYFGKRATKTSDFVTMQIMLAGQMTSNFLPVAQKFGIDGVKEMMVGTGLDNPLAAWVGILIGLGWTYLGFMMLFFIPPWQTMRQMFTKKVIPGVLMASSMSIENYDKLPPPVKEQFYGAWDKIMEGDMAGITAYEPRILTIPESSLAPVVRELMVQCDHLMLDITYFVLDDKDAKEDPENKKSLDSCVLLLKSTGAALASSEEKDLDAVNKAIESFKETQAALEDTARHVEYLPKATLRVADAAATWLRHLHHKEHDDEKHRGILGAVKDWINDWKPLLVVSFLPFMRYIEIIPVLFQPKRWCLRDFMWAFEYATGLCLIFLMINFWDGYRNFGIDVDNIPDVSLFHGWELLAYHWTWLATLEGTFHKGIHRLIGTVLGAFWGWVAVIVCSWSYDDDAPINGAGLGVWIGIWTVLTYYIFMKIPQVGDGWVSAYFTVVMGLVSCYTFYGNGTKTDLMINRMFSNFIGIMMALFFSFLPPNIRGADPKHTREYLDLLKKEIYLLVDKIKDGDLNDSEVKKAVDEVRKHRKQVRYYLQDAEKGAGLIPLPVLRVDKRIYPVLERIELVECIFQRMVTAGIRIQKEQPEQWATIQDAFRNSKGALVEFDEKTLEDGSAMRYLKLFRHAENKLIQEDAALKQVTHDFAVKNMLGKSLLAAEEAAAAAEKKAEVGGEEANEEDDVEVNTDEHHAEDAGVRRAHHKEKLGSGDYHTEEARADIKKAHLNW